jgi:mannosyl-3-phosphoglycerate phosphatase
MGAQSDKGTAVTRLTRLFYQQFGPVETIGLGDSANDAPLLAAVDRPYLLQKPDGRWQSLPDTMRDKVAHVAAVGPAGWRQVILSELAQQSH